MLPFGVKTCKANNEQQIAGDCCFVGCDIWCATVREGQRVWFFGNWVLRGISWAKRDEMTGNGEYCIKGSFGFYTAHPILFGW